MKSTATEEGESMARVLHIPEILGIQEAKNRLSQMMKDVEYGQTYIITGTKGRSALVIGLDEFKELQDSYLEIA
jgi:prevent-host-death family protein